MWSGTYVSRGWRRQSLLPHARRLAAVSSPTARPRSAWHAGAGRACSPGSIPSASGSWRKRSPTSRNMLKPRTRWSIWTVGGEIWYSRSEMTGPGSTRMPWWARTAIGVCSGCASVPTESARRSFSAAGPGRERCSRLSCPTDAGYGFAYSERLAERRIAPCRRSGTPFAMATTGRVADLDRGAVPPIRVLAVDDHPMYRAGLTAVLSLHADLDLVAEAGDGARAVELFRTHRPDVTLMDLRMPVMGGAEAIEAITAAFPDAKIIALTTYQGDTDIHRALEAGARGYLLKDVLRNEVADAIRTVYRDGWVLPSAVAQRLARFTPRIELTDRELEVLRLMAKGLRNKNIADAIGRTEGTVKVHVGHVLQKLDVDDRTEAVIVALQRGIIHLD